MKKLNQKGFSLLEVLAVVVILGIIASIAVPAISTTIENNKKDSYVATAQTMIDQTRFAILINDTNLTANTDGNYTLEELIAEGYIEQVKTDPWGVAYNETTSVVVVSGSDYSVHLISASGWQIGANAAGAVAETALNRNSVTEQ